MGGREPLGEGGRDLRMEAVALTPRARIILPSSGAGGVSVGDGVGGSTRVPVLHDPRVSLRLFPQHLI